MLALHLLQSALVHVNTLLMHQVLADPKWAGVLTYADRRALSPLLWTHVNPYGRFELDMNSQLHLDMTAAAVPESTQSAAGPGGTGREIRLRHRVPGSVRCRTGERPGGRSGR